MYGELGLGRDSVDDVVRLTAVLSFIQNLHIVDSEGVGIVLVRESVLLRVVNLLVVLIPSDREKKYQIFVVQIYIETTQPINAHSSVRVILKTSNRE